MTDVHAPEVRSRNMAAVRAKDTQVELTLRRALHAAGLRYRIHVRQLPGTPDIVFPRKYHAVIFIHGCFYHGHECQNFRWPKQNADFWRAKILANVSRDVRAERTLLGAGWRVLTVWECAIRGARRRTTDELTTLVKRWLLSGRVTGTIQAR